MHWTAFLAYRRFPAHARVADDLPCIGCGYNLRSLLARANCTECGRPVGDSLFVLAQPQVVGNCLKSIGGTFFGVLAMLIPILNPNAAWPSIVAMGLLTVVAAVRAAAVFELRYRGAIHALPIIGLRLRVLLGLSVADVLVSAAACILMWLAAQGGGPGGIIYSAANTVLALWLIVYLATAFVAGLFGSAIAVMLAYFLSRWEFILHRVSAGLCVACVSLLIVLGLSPTPSMTAVVVLMGLAALFLGGSMILLALGLLHLGGGAEHENETWEDVLDTDEG